MSNILTKDYQVGNVCAMVGISRQAYYKRLTRIACSSHQLSSLEQLVIKEREVKSRVGLRVIYHKNNLSTSLGVNQFEQKMSALGYALKPRKSFIKTTDSRGQHHKCDNLISGKTINGGNQIISGDITYFQSSIGLFYIFSLTDLYTLEIKGIIASRNMQAIHAEKCLRQVMRYNGKKQYKSQLIVHTDGGGQYRSNAYQEILRKAGALPSQAKTCFENGLAERINGIIKNDYLIDFTIKSEKQLNKVLKQVQKDHNQLWPSARLGYKTPYQYSEWINQLSPNQRPIMKIKEIK